MRPLAAPRSLAAVATVSLLATACGDDPTSHEPGVLAVVASTTIVADWVANVGGEHVRVTSLVPRSTDAHSYVLVPSDIQRVAAADVVFIVGASLESSFERAVSANADGDLVVLTEGLDLKPFPVGLAHEGDSTALDPHIFLDADLAIAAVARIRDVLVERDPEHAGAYTTNGAAYIETLRAVDAELARRLAGLPENRRYLVTFHDAYGYFAARYGLELLGFIVESPDEQPAASAIADLIDAIETYEVEYIFTEPQFDSRIIDQLAADAGVEVREIPSDALSDAYPDYVSFLRAIADGIAR